MGARSSMLFYAGGEVGPALRRGRNFLDRAATRAFVQRLHPGHILEELADGTLAGNALPRPGTVYAACLPGVAILCTTDAQLDPPSGLQSRFLAEAGGRTLYVHGMHSVVEWFAYAVWSPDGTLDRSLSLSVGNGVTESLGTLRPFEAPYWSGEHDSLDDEEDDDEEDLEDDDITEDDPDYVEVRFDPMDMAEAAFEALFGFSLMDDDENALGMTTLVGFSLQEPGE